ncbi:hypothetical protein [Mucilaginibacter pedocola]|uniref:DUF4369 domain-containing protein n=1 Tax=Mucilaginibacter pedocola TaxID=1792845 RepID=A0A1S9PC70_9SPHI|nr:hypothetical protein [Mucilaginibacter pedocola]OOQ58582.1 hypothetical protein BC343_07915 [Mucilaginibacter pedocola]
MPYARHAAFTLLLMFAFAVCARAQEAKGTTYRKISNDRLAAVKVTNLKNHIIAISDELGNYTIKANIGDTLEFTKADYTVQKQEYEGFAMIVYMQPGFKLNEVRITGQTKKQELREIMGQYKSQGTFYNGKPPVLSFLTNPITGVYELFGKTPNRAKRFAQFAKRELEATEVDRRYNSALVMKVTGLTDSAEVAKFMAYWRPSYEDLKIWADYDLMKRIRTNYNYYRRNGDKYQPLPQLTAPESLGGPGPIKIKKP